MVRLLSAVSYLRNMESSLTRLDTIFYPKLSTIKFNKLKSRKGLYYSVM